jgi:hypothetical protein
MAQHARRVLGRSGGDRKATAKLLGITQKELDSHCT